jgi:uncharacterized protein (TIGR00375 family)
MLTIADLHLHSRYSRATSSSINIGNLEKYARIKGLNLLGTGDFTHPLWLKELKEALTESGDGLPRTKTGFPFILQAEIANIYEQDGKARKIHIVLLSPDFETCEQVNEYLSKHGNLSADGRPIFSRLTCPEMTESLMAISRDITVIPAHVWTPWFGIFGSKSGFDSVEECFKDQTRHIFALETGLSSDPAMNWRLSKLDRYSLISSSDAHSFWPWRLGREANAFEMDKPSYDTVIKTIKEKDNKTFKFTIEMDPACGKYHIDGHRNCDVRLEPKESMKMDSICPVCRRQLTIGVLHRVEELADRPEGYTPKGAVPFKSLIPLSEIISTVLEISQPSSTKVWDEYNKLVKRFGSEFNIMLKASEEELRAATSEKIADMILMTRRGEAKIKPGYDGVYGSLTIGDDQKEQYETNKSPQSTLGSYLDK